jgi:hypothetical protein
VVGIDWERVELDIKGGGSCKGGTLVALAGVIGVHCVDRSSQNSGYW